MKTATFNPTYLSLLGLGFLMSFASCSSELVSPLEASYKDTAVKLAFDVNDADQDGLSNDTERFLGTNPNVADTDGDGILDGIEDYNKNGFVDATESNPLKVDTDKDGILDGIEDFNHNGLVDVDETKTVSTDSDEDGILDGVEDMNHNGQFDNRETDPANADTDGDGILDGVEDANHNGLIDLNETYALNIDSDGDLVEDGVEDLNHDGKVDANESDPKKHDTDGDSVDDGKEDKNHNGKVDAHESDPKNHDTDGDGINDKDDDDANGNGIKDIDESSDEDNVGVEEGVEYQATVITNEGYYVRVKIQAKEVNAESQNCQNGYNYTVSLDYEIKISGSNKPDSLYTLQGTINKGSKAIFFDLPNEKGNGSVNTSSDWTDQTNCDNTSVDSMNFDNIIIEIEGPGMAHQFVTLSKND
jgi:hypothetical protein